MCMQVGIFVNVDIGICSGYMYGCMYGCVFRCVYVIVILRMWTCICVGMICDSDGKRVRVRVRACWSVGRNNSGWGDFIKIDEVGVRKSDSGETQQRLRPNV